MKKELGKKIKQNMEKCWGSEMQKSNEPNPLNPWKDINGKVYNSRQELSDAEAHSMARHHVKQVFGYKEKPKTTDKQKSMQKSEDQKPIDNSAKEFLKEFGESKLLKADMEDNDSKMDASSLEAVKHHVAEIESSFDFSQDLPDWVDALITEAADRLAKVAHFIQGAKQGELHKSIAKKLAKMKGNK